MDLGLKSKVAIVAASSQGIGLATAAAFAAEGCKVAMCARNEQTLARAAEDIRKQYSAEVFASALDVADETSTSVARSARTPRPTRTPQRKITTDTTVAAMNRNTNCFPFS